MAMQAKDWAPQGELLCAVCGGIVCDGHHLAGEPDSALCGNCYKAALIWAAKQARAEVSSLERAKRYAGLVHRGTVTELDLTHTGFDPAQPLDAKKLPCPLPIPPSCEGQQLPPPLFKDPLNAAMDWLATGKSLDDPVLYAMQDQDRQVKEMDQQSAEAARRGRSGMPMPDHLTAAIERLAPKTALCDEERKLLFGDPSVPKPQGLMCGKCGEQIINGKCSCGQRPFLSVNPEWLATREAVAAGPFITTEIVPPEPRPIKFREFL